MMCLWLVPKRNRVEPYCPKMLTLVSKKRRLGATPASRFGSRERSDADAVVLVQETAKRRRVVRPFLAHSSNPAILDRGVHLTGPVVLVSYFNYLLLF